MGAKENGSEFVRLLLDEIARRYPAEAEAVWSAVFSSESSSDRRRASKLDDQVAIGAMAESVLHQKLRSVAPALDVLEENRERRRLGLHELPMPISKKRNAYSVSKAAREAAHLTPPVWGNTSERRLRAKFSTLTKSEKRRASRAFAEAERSSWKAGQSADAKTARQNQAVEQLIEAIRRAAGEFG